MKTTNWKKFSKLLDNIPKKLEKEIAKANKRNAAILEAQIVKTIKNQTEDWAPLHPKTIERKGSDKKLIDTGTLQQAASTTKINNFTTLVTINRGTKDGVNIAPVHEYGAIISVTPKMRGFLHSIGIHLKTSTTKIIIPPRPFVEPSYTRKLNKFTENYEKALENTFL